MARFLTKRIVQSLTRAVLAVSAILGAFISGVYLQESLTTRDRTRGMAVAQILQPLHMPVRRPPPAQDLSPAEIEEEYSYIQDKHGGIFAYQTGKYTNYPYGFSISIPKRMLGIIPVPPAPQHGVHLDLSPREDVEATVDVFAMYNSLEWESLNEAVDNEIAYVKGEQKDLLVLERTATRLGRLPATRYLLRYTDAKSGQKMIRDQIIAMRRDEGIVYEVYLLTPEARYNKDKEVFEQVLTSWQTENTW